MTSNTVINISRPPLWRRIVSPALAQLPYVARLIGYGSVGVMIYTTGQVVGAAVANSVSHREGFMMACSALTDPNICRTAYEAYLLRPPLGDSAAMLPPEALAANRQGRPSFCGPLRNGDNDSHKLAAAVNCP